MEEFVSCDIDHRKVYAYTIRVDELPPKHGYVRIAAGTDLVGALHAICANQFLTNSATRKFIEYNFLAGPTATGAAGSVSDPLVSVTADIEVADDHDGQVMELWTMLDRPALKLFKTLVEERLHRLAVDPSLATVEMRGHPIHRTHGGGPESHIGKEP